MDSIPGLSRYKNGRKDRGLVFLSGPVGAIVLGEEPGTGEIRYLVMQIACFANRSINVEKNETLNSSFMGVTFPASSNL